MADHVDRRDVPTRREFAACAPASRAPARDMDAEDARGYFGDEVAGATLDGDARDVAETFADFDADFDDDGDDRVVARARRAVRGVDERAGESRVEAVVERCARAAARAREEARERESRARDADGGGRADDDETTSARAIEACAEVRAVGRDVEARVERAVRECEETVRMGATETMRARAYDVATAAARFRLKAATVARETVRALDAGDLERACVLVSGARATFDEWRRGEGARDATRDVCESVALDAARRIETEAKRETTNAWFTDARAIQEDVAVALREGKSRDAVMEMIARRLHADGVRRSAALCARLGVDFADWFKRVRREQFVKDVAPKVVGASRAATATARELDHALGYFACQLHAVETFPDVVSSDDVEREWMNACQTLRGNVLSVDAREMGTVIERTRATCAVVEGVFGFPVEPLANAVDALELISRPKQSDE